MLRNNRAQNGQNNQNISQGMKRRSEPDTVSCQEAIETIPQPQTRRNPMSMKSFNKRKEYERDENVLSRRQKQIDFGKNTLAYDKYRRSVSKDQRTKDDPKTPPKHLQMNRRAFDGLVKNWKIKLHEWNLQNSIDNENVS